MGGTLMDVQQQGVLTLIRCGLTGEKLALPEEFDFEKAYEVLQRHQVLALGYVGAVNCGISKQEPVMRRLFQNYGQCLQHSEQQLGVAERICKAFDEAGVDYMPLKGCRLKRLYPTPELRSMGDLDILIRVEQYEKIRPLLLQMDLCERVESDHELIWEKGKLMVELHKRLIPSYNRDYYRYFGDGWRLARVERGTRYEMSPEDEFVYLFTHFAKHYRDGGIGLRHLADLWVVCRARPEADMDYICRELKKLDLLTFFKNVDKTAKAWFGEGEWDELSLFLMAHVFGSCAYGTQRDHNLAGVVRETGGEKSVSAARFSRVGKVIFLPLEPMAEKYPVLKRAPVLLPLFWIVRGITVLLFRRQKAGQLMHDFRESNTRAVDAYERDLNFVGLNFKFEE